MTPAQIEQLIDAKLARAFAAISRYDALMTRVEELLAPLVRIQEAAGSQVRQQSEQFDSLVTTLEALAAQRAAQCAEFAKSLAAQRELRDKLAILLAQLEARTPTEPTILQPRKPQ